MPSERLLRHFNILNVNELSETNQKYIFTQILTWGFRNYAPAWRQNIAPVV